MRLLELFLVETTEEDRALISLSSAIYKMVQPYVNTEVEYDDEDQEAINLGKIGNLFNTPMIALEKVGIEIQSGEAFLRRADSIPSSDSVKVGGVVLAIWDGETKSIVLNQDYLDMPRMRTTITHELRHGLDEIKSKSFGYGDANSYFTPRKKEHRTGRTNYIAQPAEINARFSEVLHVLAVSVIPKAVAFSEDPKAKIMHDFRHLLIKYEIATLFPEKTESKNYKRLIKRAVDFIDKELSHRQAKQ